MLLWLLLQLLANTSCCCKIKSNREQEYKRYRATESKSNRDQEGEDILSNKQLSKRQNRQERNAIVEGKIKVAA